MKIEIEIDLTEVDYPLYGTRIRHALSGLLHESEVRDLGGEYVFTCPASKFEGSGPVDTTVRVTQHD